MAFRVLLAGQSIAGSYGTARTVTISCVDSSGFTTAKFAGDEWTPVRWVKLHIHSRISGLPEQQEQLLDLRAELVILKRNKFRVDWHKAQVHNLNIHLAVYMCSISHGWTLCGLHICAAVHQRSPGEHSLTNTRNVCERKWISIAFRASAYVCWVNHRLLA